MACIWDRYYLRTIPCDSPRRHAHTDHFACENHLFSVPFTFGTLDPHDPQRLQNDFPDDPQRIQGSPKRPHSCCSAFHIGVICSWLHWAVDRFRARALGNGSCHARARFPRAARTPRWKPLVWLAPPAGNPNGAEEGPTHGEFSQWVPLPPPHPVWKK